MIQKIKKPTIISLILILAISTFGGFSIVYAQPTPITKATTAYCGIIPDSVGVGQEALIHLGIASTSAGTAYGWEGLTVTVIAPDGTIQTLGPFTTDATGGTGTSFTPTQVGTYTFQTHFPEQDVPIPYYDLNMGVFFPAGSTFLASNSDVISLVVSEDQIERYPDLPLPTEFWSRPIDGQQRSWSTISGNWLESGAGFESSPYTTGPETSHILWTKQYTIGGIPGGLTGDHGMEDGEAYENKWDNPIIMNGVLYYRRYGEFFLGFPMNNHLGVVAVDLRTGEELWLKEGMDIDFGQLFYFDSYNFHGVYDYLWDVQGSTWNAYDPFTGDWEWGMTDVPDGIRYTGPNGEFYILVTDFTNGWMALWNQTLVGFIESQKSFIDPAWFAGSWGVNIMNKAINVSTAFSWNVTIPTDLPPITTSIAFDDFTDLIDDRLIGMNLSPVRDSLKMWAISVKPGQEGQILYNIEWIPPAECQDKINVFMYQGATPYGQDGVFVMRNQDDRKYYGFSLDNGAFLWETESEHYLQSLDTQSVIIVDDKMYSAGVAGIVYCYDVHTGERLWTYEAEDPYSEYLFGNNWWGFIPFIADGKVYLGHLEHSPLDPRPRGAPFVCLDAETGEVIWRVDGLLYLNRGQGAAIIADGIITTLNSYDQRIYAIGKGPSQTTVSAPNVGVMQGSSIVVRGTVKDISAGTDDPAVTARFPNGVPAVSDKSMNDWMTYVYKQFPYPENVQGVDVSLDVIDANGNFRNIGTATSDASGFYTFNWTPDIPGMYTVIATFAGSEAYYPSYCETSFAVDQTPEATPAPMTDTYILGMGATAVVAIIVIGLIIILMLRKR